MVGVGLRVLLVLFHCYLQLKRLAFSLLLLLQTDRERTPDCVREPLTLEQSIGCLHVVDLDRFTNYANIPPNRKGA